MYKIYIFDNKLCHILRHHLDLVEEDCGIYSIWKFCPRTRWRAVRDFIADKPLCHASWFPVIYWMVLAISTWACVFTLCEFVTLFWADRRRQISMWRPRKYYVLSYTVRRRCRLAGALVMLYTRLLLWYAVVRVSPSHMTPWLTMNAFVLGFELVTWIAELCMCASRLDAHTVFAFALPMANYWFVRCVRNVFQRAIDTDHVDELRLWKISQ